MNKENEKLLREYDVKKLLIKLSLPAIAGMAINALYNFVSRIFMIDEHWAFNYKRFGRLNPLYIQSFGVCLFGDLCS